MKFRVLQTPIQLLFLIIWIFFLVRILSYIDVNNNILQFKLENIIKFIKDSLSIFIFIILITYLIFEIIKNKKIHISIILIIYPICGVVGYYTNGIKNSYQDAILFHHFITLSSVIFFFTAIQSNKIFDYEFKELLLKVILIFVFIFFFFIIIPDFIIKIFLSLSLQSSNDSEISIFGTNFNLKQNINGSSRVIFILLIIFLILFKKKFIINKNLSNFFFSISTLLYTMIFVSQSRYNILASILIIIATLANIKKIKLTKKITYFLIIIIVPIIIFNFVESNNRIISIPKPKLEIYELPIDNFDVLCQKKQVGKFESTQRFICENSRSLMYKDYLRLNELTEELFPNKNNLTNSDLILFNELKRIIKVSGIALMETCRKKFDRLDSLSTGRLCGWFLLLNDINKKEILFGRGFFADQVYLEPVQKLSSNSFINILFNTGIVGFFLCLTFLAFSLKYFKFKNIYHKNYFISLSHYLILYFIFRSLLEDTLTFVSLDFLLFLICFIIIKEKNNGTQNS